MSPDIRLVAVSRYRRGTATLGLVDPRVFTEPKETNMADDRVIQIAVSPGTQEFPDEVYLLYQSGAVFHGSLSEEP